MVPYQILSPSIQALHPSSQITFRRSFTSLTAVPRVVPTPLTVLALIRSPYSKRLSSGPTIRTYDHMPCARVHIETHRKHFVSSGPAIDGYLLLDVSLVGGGSWGCGCRTMLRYGGDNTHASAHSLCTFPFSLPIVHWVPPDRPASSS